MADDGFFDETENEVKAEKTEENGDEKLKKLEDEIKSVSEVDKEELEEEPESKEKTKKEEEESESETEEIEDEEGISVGEMKENLKESSSSQKNLTPNTLKRLKSKGFSLSDIAEKFDKDYDKVNEMWEKELDEFSGASELKETIMSLKQDKKELSILVSKELNKDEPNNEFVIKAQQRKSEIEDQKMEFLEKLEELKEKENTGLRGFT